MPDALYVLTLLTKDRVDECIMEEVRKWWQRGKELAYA